MAARNSVSQILALLKSRCRPRPLQVAKYGPISVWIPPNQNMRKEISVQVIYLGSDSTKNIVGIGKVDIKGVKPTTRGLMNCG